MGTPKIRFAGFTGDWEQRKLGELVTIGDIDHRMPETVDNGIPYLMTGDFCGINELNFDGVKHISEDDYKQLSRKIKPEKGDILFARYASVGAVRYVDFTDRFLISYSCAILKHGDKVDSKFLYHYLTGDIAQKQIALEINTGSQANIGIDSMKNNIVVQMPCVKEQYKIASCLDSIDNLIRINQRKCGALKDVKKYMLQKMFPKKGEKVPEIRFAGFTGDWEQRKLGSLAEFNPKSILPNKFEYVDLESVMGTEIIAHRTERKDTAPSRAQRLAQVGDVFYQTVRPYQKNNCLFDGSDEPYVFSTGYAQMRPRGDSYFLLTIVQKDDFVNDVLDRCTGTSYPAINSADLSDIVVKYPVDLGEQAKIGKNFRDIDNLIILHQRKCDTLKEIKKYMLQNMFPKK